MLVSGKTTNNNKRKRRLKRNSKQKQKHQKLSKTLSHEGTLGDGTSDQDKRLKDLGGDR